MNKSIWWSSTATIFIGIFAAWPVFDNLASALSPKDHLVEDLVAAVQGVDGHFSTSGPMHRLAASKRVRAAIANGIESGATTDEISGAIATAAAAPGTAPEATQVLAEAQKELTPEELPGAISAPNPGVALPTPPAPSAAGAGYFGG